jgi:hypothetical protein
MIGILLEISWNALSSQRPGCYRAETPPQHTLARHQKMPNKKPMPIFPFGHYPSLTHSQLFCIQIGLRVRYSEFSDLQTSRFGVRIRSDAGPEPKKCMLTLSEGVLRGFCVEWP